MPDEYQKLVGRKIGIVLDAKFSMRDRDRDSSYKSGVGLSTSVSGGSMIMEGSLSEETETHIELENAAYASMSFAMLPSNKPTDKTLIKKDRIVAIYTIDNEN